MNDFSAWFIYDHMSGLKCVRKLNDCNIILQSYERKFIKFSLDEYFGAFLFLDLYFLSNVTEHKIALS